MQFGLALAAVKGSLQRFILQTVALSAFRTGDEESSIVGFHCVHTKASFIADNSRVING